MAPKPIKPHTEANDGKSRRRRQDALPADWEGADASVLLKAIGTVARCGGALRFGYTRDGGAYSLGVLGDGEPYTLYFRPSDDITKALENIIDDWSDVP